MSTSPAPDAEDLDFDDEASSDILYGCVEWSVAQVVGWRGGKEQGVEVHVSAVG